MGELEDFDQNEAEEMGRWSPIKLEIIEKYAKAYTPIMSKQGLTYGHIDGFAGMG